MDFSNQYNGWKSTRKERRLRKKEGYIKTPNIGGSGFPGYVRSKALTVQNALKLSNRAAHHAEARQARVMQLDSLDSVNTCVIQICMGHVYEEMNKLAKKG